MQIILIGNYKPDRQESMERFTMMLESGFRKAGFNVEIWRPSVYFGALTKSTVSGLGKWLGYIDKWILFPGSIRWRLLFSPSNAAAFYHICDHSNAPYLQHLPLEQTGITCHDVLAIRGAFGEPDAYCKASAFGYYYQKWILKHLSNSKRIAVVSEQTLSQLKKLVQHKAPFPNQWQVIYNAFNNEFKPREMNGCSEVLPKVGINSDVPYILHVGSSLPRKNRKLLVDMVVALGERWMGNICYAGEAADEELELYIRKMKLQDRVFFVVKPDHSTLVALYSTCEAFVFPSFSEGFGWPVIEAQACGAPVIASNIEPMPEVSGGTALHASPSNPQQFADAFLSLTNEVKRAEVIRRGFANAARFRNEQMVEAYLELYGLANPKPNLHVV